MRLSKKNKIVPILIEVFAILFLLTTLASAEEISRHHKVRKQVADFTSLASMKADFSSRARQIIRPSEVEELRKATGDNSIEAGPMGILADNVDATYETAIMDGFDVDDEHSQWLAASGYFLRLRAFTLKIQDAGIKGAESDPMDFSALFKGDPAKDVEPLCKTDNPEGLSYFNDARKAVREGMRDLRMLPMDKKEADNREAVGVGLKGPLRKVVQDMLTAYGAELDRAKNICRFFNEYAEVAANTNTAVKLEDIGVGEGFLSVGRIDEADGCQELFDTDRYPLLDEQTEEEWLADCQAHAKRRLNRDQQPLGGNRRALELFSDDLKVKQPAGPQRGSEADRQRVRGTPVGNVRRN